MGARIDDASASFSSAHLDARDLASVEEPRVDSLGGRSENKVTGAVPYSSRSSSNTVAATPPKPLKSSANTWNPRRWSHSSAQNRTASLASSRRSSVRKCSTPSPKPANKSTPRHNPGKAACDLGWKHALQKSVHDFASSVSSAAADASSAADRRSSSSFRRRCRSSLVSVEDGACESDFSVFAVRSASSAICAAIFARSAAMASTSPPFLDRFVDPPHWDRRRPPRASSSSSDDSSVSILASGSWFSSSSSSSSSSSWYPSPASSSRLRRKADLCAGSCLNTLCPSSQLVIAGRSSGFTASSSP
mmetsp:Transcript_8261/g.37626  ORF Transcript_8261/g.37626 Transcript_8261/m.37626 type:complete len:305 (-) Transcript_8261:271-1185(-)